MSRGRPKKPTHQKILEGTYRKDREPTNPLPLESLESLPKAPGYLTKTGQKVWRVVVDRLFKLGVLYDLHLELLAMYCGEVAMYQDMSVIIKEKQEKGQRLYSQAMGKDAKKVIELRMRDDALKNALTLGAKFGFTLSDIKGIELPDDAVSPGSDPYNGERPKPFLLGNAGY
jgi:P27 family predicted phage terminase small subunit